MAGVHTEIWARDIAEHLFDGSEFCTKGINDSAFVVNKTVHLNQAGAKVGVVRNRNTYPAQATRRVDTSPNYDIDEFTTDPRHIPDVEETETNYGKRQSILTEDVSTIQEEIGDWMAYHWSATVAPNIVRTTGGDRETIVAGATGNRKKMVLADILTLKRMMDAQKVPVSGRVALLTSEMYNDLLEIEQVLNAETNQRGRLPDGVVNSIFGFNFMIRSKVASFTNDALPTLRVPDAADLATANAGSIFWHPNFVRYAKGAVKVFSKNQDPQYYGDVISSLARMGGKIRYSDQKGVFSLVESAGA